MIKCKDCKHWIVGCQSSQTGKCQVNECPVTLANDMITYSWNSCEEAERTDGLVECCATCRHNKTEWSEEHVGKRTHAKCSKKCFDIVVFHDDLWDTFKMLCPEWQPREEKE